MIATRPFTIDVPDDVLDDLRGRLARTRWPDEPPTGRAWQFGTDLAYMRSLVAYWRDVYDWRHHEARLNRMPQFVAEIRGVDVHFVQQRGVGSNPMPLLLTHGWPGSIVEFERLIPLLTDPARFGGDPHDAFTVVAPSLPGFAFSYRVNQPRFNIADIAEMFAMLMRSLGYDRFGAQGGDWRAYVTAQFGAAHAANVAGIHVTLLSGPREDAPEPLTEEERAYTAELRHWMREEEGYGFIQGTKPQTLAYALMDSPAGLAAWIVEKFRTWSDCDGDVERRFSKDVVLTNTMLYWTTPSIRRFGCTGLAGTNPGRSAHTTPYEFRRGTHRSRRRSCIHRAPGSSQHIRTFNGGRQCLQAGISRRMRSQSCSPRTFVHCFERFGKEADDPFARSWIGAARLRHISTTRRTVATVHGHEPWVAHVERLSASLLRCVRQTRTIHRPRIDRCPSTSRRRSTESRPNT
jgi:microsomal epoxide hydrolase